MLETLIAVVTVRLVPQRSVHLLKHVAERPANYSALLA
jgi:hypothetical protein